MAKTITGIVTSAATDKTIVITEHVRKTHPLYKKQYTVTSKFMAHDERNECKVGDRVVITETRPLSARKRYTLQSILEKATLTQEQRDVIEKEEDIVAKPKKEKPEVKEEATPKEKKAEKPVKKLEAKDKEEE